MIKKKIKEKIWKFFRPTWLKIGILIFLIVSVFLGIFGFSFFSREIGPFIHRPNILLLSDPLEQFWEWILGYFNLPDKIFVPIALLYYYIYSCIIASLVIFLSNKLIKLDKKMARKKPIYRHLYYFLRPTTAKIIPFLVLITLSFIISAVFRYFEPVTLLAELLHYLKLPDKLSVKISIAFGVIFYYVLCCLIVFVIKYLKNKIKKK